MRSLQLLFSFLLLTFLATGCFGKNQNQLPLSESKKVLQPKKERFENIEVRVANKVNKDSDIYAYLPREVDRKLNKEISSKRNNLRNQEEEINNKKQALKEEQEKFENDFKVIFTGDEKTNNELISLYRKAVKSFKNNDYEKALTIFNKILLRYSYTSIAPSVLLMTAQIHFEQGDYAESLTYSNALTTRHSDNILSSQGMLYEGKNNYFLGNYDKALSILGKAKPKLNKKEMLLEATYFCALSLHKKVKDKEAFLLLNKTVEENNKSAINQKIKNELSRLANNVLSFNQLRELRGTLKRSYGDAAVKASLVMNHKNNLLKVELREIIDDYLTMYPSGVDSPYVYLAKKNNFPKPHQKKE